jgi:hypothetical protein
MARRAGERFSPGTVLVCAWSVPPPGRMSPRRRSVALKRRFAEVGNRCDVE